MMILDQGEKIHVIERRQFPEDVRRHFVGEVVRCGETAFRARGHIWVFDSLAGHCVRRDEVRERVMALGDRLVINVLPPETNMENVRYLFHQGRGLMVTDDEHLFLEINEFSAMR